MVWGKKRKREAELIEQQNLQDAQAKKEVWWVRTTPSEAVEKMFDGFIAESKLVLNERGSGILSIDKSTRKTLNQLHRDLNGLRKTWNSIDVRLVSDDEAQIMFSALWAIPSVLDIFKRRAADCFNDIEPAYSEGSGTLIRYTRIRQLSLGNRNWNIYEGEEDRDAQPSEQSKSVKDQLAALSNTILYVKNKNKDKVLTAEASENQNAFSASNYSKDRELFSALTKLEKLWKQASQVSHSIEDRYFLDEALERYIPDALNTYASFIHVPTAAKQEARRMLFQQLNLIEKELRRLARASVSSNLQQMQAQVDFLKMKVED